MIIEDNFINLFLFEIKCPVQKTHGEKYELRLISGVAKQNITLCDLKVYKGSSSFQEN